MVDDDRNWKHEANMIERAARAEIRRSGFIPPDLVPPGERIESQPERDKLPAGFLQKTASHEEQEQLSSILTELWTINQEWVGERTAEAEALLCLTGRQEPLTERIRTWCDNYFARRIDKANTKDQHPLQKFERLIREYDEVFGKLCMRSGAVYFVFLGELAGYVQWLLLVWMWRGIRGRPTPGQIPIVLSRDPSQLSGYPAILDELGLLQPNLACFLSAVAEAGGYDARTRLARFGDQDVRSQLSGLADDILQMRPFVVRNFRPEKSVLSIGGPAGMTIAWSWTCVSGMAHVWSGPSIEYVLNELHRGTTRMPIKVSYDGVLRDGRTPWITAVNECRVEGLDSLAANLHVVSLFYERLFSFYDQIDFERIRHAARGHVVSDIADEEVAEDEQLGQSLADFAMEEERQQTPSTPDERGRLRRLSSVRMQDLCRFLERYFGCEVRQGKGSEITLTRAGVRRYTIGSHGRNRPVEVCQLKRLLKVLDIAPRDWLRQVYA